MKELRIALTIFSSLLSVLLALFGMIAAHRLTFFLGKPVGDVSAIFGGIVFFAVGVLVFWRFSLRLAGEGSIG